MSFDADAYLEKHGGDAKVALTKLAADGKRSRDAKNQLLEALGLQMDDTESVEAAKKRLTDELKAYRSLGKPEELQEQLELGKVALESFKGVESDPAKLKEVIKTLPKRLETAEGELTTLKRSSVVRDAADAYGFKPAVLERLLKTDGLELVFESDAEREVERNGKKEKVKGVAKITVDGKPVTLEQHVASAWADFAPSLAAQPATDKPSGRQLPTLGGKGESPATTTVEKRAEEVRLEYGSSI